MQRTCQTCMLKTRQAMRHLTRGLSRDQTPAATRGRRKALTATLTATSYRRSSTATEKMMTNGASNAPIRGPELGRANQREGGRTSTPLRGTAWEAALTEDSRNLCLAARCRERPLVRVLPVQPPENENDPGEDSDPPLVRSKGRQIGRRKEHDDESLCQSSNNEHECWYCVDQQKAAKQHER